MTRHDLELGAGAGACPPQPPEPRSAGDVRARLRKAASPRCACARPPRSSDAGCRAGSRTARRPSSAAGALASCGTGCGLLALRHRRGPFAWLLT
eukprot:scaffold7267_cov395-Prasinococcus_capsulatus_cf.AAC.4